MSSNYTLSLINSVIKYDVPNLEVPNIHIPGTLTESGISVLVYRCHKSFFCTNFIKSFIIYVCNTLCMVLVVVTEALNFFSGDQD